MYRVVLIDDEHWPLMGLKNSINWEKYDAEVVLCTSDAEEALAFILENNIDVVITDINMPRVSGLELMKEVRKNNIDVQFIIVSGYDDFSYAKEALQLGTDHYILKPLNEMELLTAFKKTLSKRKKSIPSTFESIIDNYLYYEEDSSLETIIDEYEINSLYKGFQCMIIESKNLDLFNFFNVSMKVIKVGLNRNLIIYNADDDLEIRVREVVDKNGGKYFKIGLSRVFYSISDLRIALMEAELAIGNTFLYSDMMVFKYEEPNKSTIEMMVSNIGMHILKRIEEIKYRIDEIKGFIYSMKLTYEEFVFLHNQIAILINILVPRSKIINVLRYDEIINHYKNLDEFISYLSEVCNLQIIGSDINRQDNISEIKRYIELHFNENLYLSDIAEAFNYSTNYICDIFRKNGNTTYSEYLRKVRMEKAQGLLLGTDMSITEIALEVGFNDYCYFGKVFKRYCHVTPNQFRKRK